MDQIRNTDDDSGRYGSPEDMDIDERTSVRGSEDLQDTIPLSDGDDDQGETPGFAKLIDSFKERLQTVLVLVDRAKGMHSEKPRDEIEEAIKTTVDRMEKTIKYLMNRRTGYTGDRRAFDEAYIELNRLYESAVSAENGYIRWANPSLDDADKKYLNDLIGHLSSVKQGIEKWIENIKAMEPTDPRQKQQMKEVIDAIGDFIDAMDIANTKLQFDEEKYKNIREDYDTATLTIRLYWDEIQQMQEELMRWTSDRERPTVAEDREFESASSGSEDSLELQTPPVY